MNNRPDLLTILPHLAVPALLALALLLWARRLGATWTQVQLSFGAAMLGAFMAASGWIFAAYLAGEALSTLRILGSQVLLGAAAGIFVFFGTMPVEQDLTEPPGERDQRP
jgi:drug/metabolite transporter (DMT)-like permease